MIVPRPPRDTPLRRPGPDAALRSTSDTLISAA
jgi:hypothetical protein